MASDPTLLFCVGAAKAGTSWLFQYFRSHPDVHLRSVKELHYFEPDDGNVRAGQIKNLQNRILKRLEESFGASDTDRDRLQDEIDDCRDLISLYEGDRENIPAYLQYLNAGCQSENVIGDFTPAYGLLAPKKLVKMSKIAGVTKFIYVLRDPVSRLWSHIRMNAGLNSSDDTEFKTQAYRMFWSFGRGKHLDIWDRSNYKRTLENLARSLDSGQLLVVFYEELFSSKTLDRICEFLGVRSFPAQRTSPVYASPKLAMKSGQLEYARQWLSPQYEFVHARYGELPPAWQANMSGVEI